MTGPSAMREMGHSKLLQWDNPKGWNAKGGGRWGGGLGWGNTCTPMADLCQCMAKPIKIS